MSPKLLSPSGETVFASPNAAPILVADHGYEELSVAVEEDTDAPAEKSIDEMSGKELDARAADLKIDDWNAKAKVDDKKQAIKHHIAARDAEKPEPDGLDDLSDDDLDAKAEELSVAVEEDTDRETLIAAIRAAIAASAE